MLGTLEKLIEQSIDKIVAAILTNSAMGEGSSTPWYAVDKYKEVLKELNNEK